MTEAVTRTELKAFDQTAITTAFLLEAGREGPWVFQSGDYSSLVALDTTEGRYIASDNVASSSGAWVRVFAGALNATWFGCVGDDATDNATALANAMQWDEPLFIPPGTYRVSAASLYPGSGRKCAYGAGSGTTIIKTTSTTAHVIGRNGSGGLSVRDLTITTTVDKSAGAAVYLSGAGARDEVADCMIHGASSALRLWRGVHVESGVIPTIRQNYFLNLKNIGVLLQRTTGSAGCEANIHGNTFNTSDDSNTALAIYWASGAGTLIISGNRVQNYDYGIYIAPVSGLTTASVVIVGNTFERTKTGSIVVSLPAASTAQMQAVNIIGNNFNIPAGAALIVAGATNQNFVLSISFKSNTVSYAVQYPVNVQAGVVFIESDNTYIACSNIKAIVVAASYPTKGMIDSYPPYRTDTGALVTSYYLLNGNTGFLTRSTVSA